VLRYFGSAFANIGLAMDLQVSLLLAPLSVLELISQLGTAGAEEAFSAVQALPRIHYAEAIGMLPWSDDFFRMCLFNLPPRGDTITPALNKAIVNILNSSNAADLIDDGKQIRASLDKGKDEATQHFSAVVDDWRTEGRLAEAEHRAIFARSIARRAGVDETKVDIDFIVNSLDAHYTFEKLRMRVGADNENYNLKKHANDVYDAELLIYLADPTLHLLTSDRGFRRVEQSSQASRVHIADEACLRDPKCASEMIESIVKTI
jgi:hypothetical protein